MLRSFLVVAALALSAGVSGFGRTAASVAATPPSPSLALEPWVVGFDYLTNGGPTVVVDQGGIDPGDCGEEGYLFGAKP